MTDHEKILKAVANRRRLAILTYLKKHHEAPVGEIAAAIHLSFKSTSRHLALLFAAGIVERDQRNLQAFYSLQREQKPIIRYLISIL